MTSPGKRSRESSIDAQSNMQDDMERPLRFRTLHTFHEVPDSNTTNPAEEGETKLANKQKRFLQLWYEDFAQLSVGSSPPAEFVSALAKVIRTEPRLVFDYIDQKHKDFRGARQSPSNEERNETSPLPLEVSRTNVDPYSFIEANDHLSPTTLSLVGKYVNACRRRRSQHDGRRSVNTGPYRCTFGCGYRTKRAFDWRRHEETHEPQELWLCTQCNQKDIQNPFLVNRKDKFLKHVNDKHDKLAAEKVLDSSKVAFVPRAEMNCPYCDTESDTWDERCRHVLGHFEDEVERGRKRVRMIHDEQDDNDESVPSVCASVKSVESGGNEIDDHA